MMMCVLGLASCVGAEQIFLSNFWQEFWRGKNFGKQLLIVAMVAERLQETEPYVG